MNPGLKDVESGCGPKTGRRCSCPRQGAIVLQDPTTPLGARALPGIWRFGTAVLDERVAELAVAGRPVSLDRSSYDVLLELLRHVGEVVTKDELLEAGWPGRIVSENSLAKAVSRLRLALGAEGESIRAVHGYGYRLAAMVGFQAVAPEKVSAYPHEATHLHEGDRLPHRSGWRLGRRLGEGRAGAIFLAVCDGEEPRAVKFATSELGLRSLKREIALARYIVAVKGELPDVAPVLDCNLSQPPFFLELPFHADGNLADWALARGGLRGIDPAARLQLCVRLCEAVAALHEIGIIHKDLKPENLDPVADPQGGWRVVVSDLGAGGAAHSPWLAELGITMSIAADAMASTHGGSMLYLAPEVIAGDMSTQRSDVFALGVLVYQLVAGDLRRSLAPGWEADIDDPLLCEDIALAAAANPERRQVDARALGLRLDSLAQRRAAQDAKREAQRLAQVRIRQIARHRTRWRIGVAACVLLGVGLVGALAMYSMADDARRDAENQARRHQAVLEFVNQDILGQGDAYGSDGTPPDLTLLAAVQRAAKHVDQRLGDDPASAAAVHAMVGAVLFARDQHAAAIGELERARALYDTAGAGNDAALTRVETALCDVRRIASDFAQAEDACMAAWTRAQRSGAEMAFATLKLGQLRTEQGRYADADALLQPLLRADAFRGQTKSQGELRWALGLGARNSGRFDEARSHFQALAALYREAAPDSTWMGWAYNSLGSVMVETGDYANAETTLLAARQAFARTQGAGQVEAQMPNTWRAEIRLRQGRWREAAAMQQALLEAWRGTLRPGHPLRLLAEANLAWAEAAAGQGIAARARLDAALRNRAVVFDGPGDRIVERTLRWIRAALALGDQAAAGELLRVLDAGLAREYPGPHPMRAEALCLRAQWSAASGEQVQAREHASACLAMLARFLAPGHPRLREAEGLFATPVRPGSARSPAARSGP
jgi:non-specific serine/threonine protein kinase